MHRMIDKGRGLTRCGLVQAANSQITFALDVDCYQIDQVDAAAHEAGSQQIAQRRNHVDVRCLREIQTQRAQEGIGPVRNVELR